MDADLLRSWLGLSPGPWPPDHYALLGLGPADADPAVVERRVLERMDRLRPHQLLNPDIVTEGMNRLAQALICLTDPAAKAAYDAELGLPPAAPAPPPEAPAPIAEPPQPGYVVVADPVVEDIFEDAAPPPDFTQVIEVPGFEVVEAADEPPARPRVRVVPPEPAERPYEIVPAEPAPPPRVRVVTFTEAAPPRDPATRRELYRRLALLRRALRAWDKLRPLVADPREPLDRPGRVLALLDAVGETRPLLRRLRGLIGRPGEPGGLIAAVIRQPVVLDTFRSLLPDQREAVAIDWRRGQSALRAEYDRLRRLARSKRPEPAGPPAALVLWKWLRDTPEVVLVLLAAAAAVLALVRGTGR